MAILTDAEVFLRAIDVLDERGWFQGAVSADESDASAAVCLIGALRVALTGAVYGVDGTMAARAVGYAEQVAPDALLPSAWNDAPGRTVEDVKLALKQAAYACEQP